LLLLPFFSGEGEKSWKRRPIAVLTILLIAVALARSPIWRAMRRGVQSWTLDRRTDPSEIRERTLAASDPGALVFQSKQCHNCHALGEIGGKRGPALDAVAVRLTGDQLVRQVLQGGGNMPAYGKNLNPAETTALVAFLESLHPSGQAPASDASRTAGVHP